MGIHLSDKAVNVHLYIAQPSKSLRAKVLEDQLVNEQGFSPYATQVQLRWMPSSVTHQINAVITALRNNLRHFCLRFGDGWILPMSLYNPYMDEFRKLHAKFTDCITELDGKHQEILALSKQAVGQYAPAALIPNYFERSYKLEHNISAIADPDTWQQTLTHEARVEMYESFNNMLQSGQVDATCDALSRIYDKVIHLADKVSDPDAIIRNSAVDNIKEIVELLPHFNLTDDPALTQLYYNLKDRFDNVTADALRKMPMFRQDQAAQLRDTATHIGEIMERFNDTPTGSGSF